MPRYLKQYDDYSCGPTAILNALKWAGASVSYRSHYKRVAKYCKVAEGDLKDRGTLSPDLDRTLRTLGRRYLTVRKVRSCTIQQLADHLQNGGAAILAHVEGEGTLYAGQDEAEGHFSFWFDSDGLTFTGANDGGDSATIVRSRKEMIHKIKKRKHAGAMYPEVWLLSKCDRSK
jgi:hypothetical protein